MKSFKRIAFCFFILGATLSNSSFACEDFASAANFDHREKSLPRVEAIVSSYQDKELNCRLPDYPLNWWMVEDIIRWENNVEYLERSNTYRVEGFECTSYDKMSGEHTTKNYSIEIDTTCKIQKVSEYRALYFDKVIYSEN